jgi:hypothetical protein
MTTKRETVLLALLAALEAQGLVVERNDAKVDDVPPAGLLVLHDGDPGEPEVLMSPLTYIYTHRAQLDIFAADVVGGDDREAVFDAICTSVGEAVAVDRTLGGLCDWVEAQAPAAQPLDAPGAAPVKAASIMIMLIYGTTDTLG